MHTLRASYGYSVEIGTAKQAAYRAERVPDYQGHGASLGGDLVLLHRNTTLSADYAIERVELTDHPIDGFWVELGYPYDAEVPPERLRPGKW